MKNLVYIFCVFMLFSCEDVPSSDETNTVTDSNQNINPTENHQSPSEAPSEFVETVKREKLLVENIYATSTAANSDVYHLFDFKEKTAWQTTTGSGPDEGIHIEFRKDHLNYVSSIELGAAPKDDLANVRLVMLYLNGQPQSFKTGKLGEKIKIDTELKSLYIRIFNTNKEVTKELEKKHATISLHQFPASAAVAIHSLNIYGKETEAYRVILPKKVKGKVSASSTLQPEVAYDVSHLFDGDTNSAWVEGEKDLGLGQRILFDLPSQIVVDAIQVWNGYQRSKHHFETNSSVKDFTFGLPNASKVYTLRNSMGGQRIELSSKILSNQFEFRITGGYQGSRYSDLALSEIILYDDDEGAMLIQSNAQDKMRQQYQSKAANTPLASILNRRIFNTFNFKYDPVVTERSLILHDNGTFVFYSKDITTVTETVEEINTSADGNWVILEAHPDRVKIRVFGSLKTYNPVELAENNKSPEDYVSLFKDVLTITKGQMEGTEIIEQLFW